MLIVSRRAGERIYVGENVVITVCTTGRGQVRLGITAPPDVRIVREEIREQSPASGAPSFRPPAEESAHALAAP